MKVLIVDDDFASRRLLHLILSPHGHCDIAVNGKEAIEAFNHAWNEKKPYDLICLDIMMPELNGQEALKIIREIEQSNGVRQVDEVKVIMTSALGDTRNVVDAFYQGGATSYLVKPIDHRKVLEELRNLGLM